MPPAVEECSTEGRVVRERGVEVMVKVVLEGDEGTAGFKYSMNSWYVSTMMCGCTCVLVYMCVCV